MDPRVMGQEAKRQIEINQIWARAFGEFYRRREMKGIIRWDELDNEILLEAINITTELATKNKKNNQNHYIRDRVSQECHHLLDVFEKEEKTIVPSD